MDWFGPIDVNRGQGSRLECITEEDTMVEHPEIIHSQLFWIRVSLAQASPTTIYFYIQ